MDNFREWLKDEKKCSEEVSNDVLSRLRRAYKLADKDINTCNIDYSEIPREAIDDMSQFIQSDIKRALMLWNEYKTVKR